MKNAVISFSRDLWLSNLTEGWLVIRSHMSNKTHMSHVTHLSDYAVTWSRVTNELRYIFIFTKPIAVKLDRVMACEIKISTTVEYGWFFIFLPNFDLIEQIYLVKRRYFNGAFIFASISTIFGKMSVWTK